MVRYLSRIRIMHVVRPVAGGIKNHLLGLIEKSDCQRFHHMVACPPGALADSLAQRRVKTFCVPIEGELSPGSDWAAIKTLIFLFKKEKVALVHAHSSKAGLVARVAAKLAGVPALVLTVHNSIFYEEWPGWKQDLFAFAERVLARFTDRIITVSDALRDELMRREKIPPGQITTIYNGIRPEDFAAAPRSDYLYECAGISPGKKIVGTVARLAPQKGVSNFIRAAALLAPQSPDTLFLIIGDGPLRCALEREAGGLGLDGRVLFLGERQDISSIMPCLDLFVLPSVTEGMPLTVLEAMAAARPVVATRVGGIPEIIADGVHGLLVSPGDIKGLAAAIGRLTANAGLSGALGTAGRMRVARHFTVELMAKRTEQIYSDLTLKGSVV